MKWAHSAGHDGSKEPLIQHLQAVAELCVQNAEIFGAADEAYCIGAWHDLGKLGISFQQVLEGKQSNVDHWAMGAHYAIERKKADGRAALLCILGHHRGIPAGNIESIRQWCPPAVLRAHPLKLKLSPENPEELGKLLAAEGIAECRLDWASFVPNEMYAQQPARAMLRTRMLFSSLVDADYIATERHFSGPSARAPGPRLEPTKLWRSFQVMLQEARRKPCSQAVSEVRETVLCSALAAAEKSERVLTLTAPTGSGKTLAMLGFALHRAKLRGHRRIILALPYLALLQEIAQVYERLIQGAYPGGNAQEYLLEAHSMAEHDPTTVERYDRSEATHRKLVENWDAPIILTTNVQLLESLHSNQPARCRKLHNLANSVILLDEVQSIPRELAAPTLAALSTLAADLGCSILMATATRPAFEAFDELVCNKLSETGWKPREVVPKPETLFQILKRVNVAWRICQEPWNEEQTVSQMLRRSSVLCIVNLKRHARRIFERLAQQDPSALFLTTSLCPKHRDHVLEEARCRLKTSTVRMVSTQCVEAGVDLDFSSVFRAFGPLEAIAQAAGRCNRHGMLDAGDFVVFEFADEGHPRFPDTAYEQATEVARCLFNKGNVALDLQSPDTFRRYYDHLFRLALPGLENTRIMNACRGLDFPVVAEEYRLIKDDAISILVPYDKYEYDELRDEALRKGLSRSWVLRARRHAVSIYRPARQSPIWSALDTIPLRHGTEATDWYILRDVSLYDRQTGFVPPKEFGFLEC